MIVRIAFVVGKFPKLSKTFILNQITGLLDLGHEVDVYARQNSEPTYKDHADMERYEIQKKIIYLPFTPGDKFKRRIKILSCYTHLASSISPVELLRLLRRHNNEKDKYIFDALTYLTIHRYKKEPYDIIHCHFAEQSQSALLLKLAHSPNAKVVTTFHGHDVNVAETVNRNSNAYKAMFEEGDLFTANTKFTANKASKLGCPKDKIKILPVGLNPSRYPFSFRQLNSNETVKIVTVGRLVEKKGIEYSIRAVASVMQKYPTLKLHYTIIGEGGQRAALEKLVLDLGLFKEVSFLGEMTQAEVKKVYDSSHLFLLSSVTASNGDMEGQGLVLQEAQCMGLPVISTLHNGIPEGVIDGQSGFLVPEKDVDALSEKLAYLALNPELWQSMGKAGHDFVKNRYNIQKLNNQLVSLYERLLLSEDLYKPRIGSL